MGSRPSRPSAFRCWCSPISSPNRTWDQTFLANYVAINIEDELARIPGIGQVKLFGASNYAMRIWVAPDILSKLQLTVADLENAIAAQNVVNPAGQIGGAPAPPGQQLTYTVRAQGRLMNADEFGDIIVRANPDGSLVRLKDVARIRARCGNLHSAGEYQRSALSDRRPVSEPGFQCARGRQSGEGQDGRTRASFSFGHEGRSDPGHDRAR